MSGYLHLGADRGGDAGSATGGSRLRQHAREHFTGYATGFDDIYEERGLVSQAINATLRTSIFKRYHATIERTQPIEGRTVVDVGCGPGRYAIELARRGAAKVVGIDFSTAMLEIARERAKEYGVADRCDFRVVDVLKDGIGDVYDYSIAMGFMDYVPDAKRFVHAMLEATRQRALFSFPMREGFWPKVRAFLYLTKTDLYLYDRARLESLFADWTNVGIELMGFDYFVTVDQPRRR